MNKLYQNETLRLLPIRVLLMAAIVLSSCAPDAPDRTLIDKPIPEIEEYLKAHARNGRFRGAVFITRGDTVLADVKIGFADIDQQIPFTDSTRFMIGSITKPFVAEAITQLVGRGLLDWDDPLTTWYPDYPRAEEITVRMLVTHTSGLADYRSIPTWKEQSQRQLHPDETLAQMAKVPMAGEPGGRSRYSNVGYIFLGRIIEKVTEKPLEVAMHELVFEPYGLTSTSVRRRMQDVPNLAIGYNTMFDSVSLTDPINLEQPFSSGNIVSTIKDIHVFVQETHNNGVWREREFDGVAAVGHVGRMNGFTAGVTYIDSLALTITILTNDDNTPIYQITEELIGLVNGNDVSLPAAQSRYVGPNEALNGWIGNHMISEGDTLVVYRVGNDLMVRETGQAPLKMFRISQDSAVFEMLERTALLTDSTLELVSPSGHRVIGRTLPY